MDWSNTTVLITGGTGSFGKAFIGIMLKKQKPKKVIVFSRDELKQHEMRSQFPDDFENPESPMRYFIGDVRDRDRLYRAFRDVDVVIHAAALKQVPACEYNPMEAILTNIIGAKNVIDAAIDCGVKRVVALSSDKAVNPVNLYGATKLCAEKLFIQANAYVGHGRRIFSCVRYGNVLGSRGSVVPVFLAQKKSGVLRVTDERMTRFWLTLEKAVQFVVDSIERMKGGEIFVPKIPSMRIVDIASAIAPQCKIEFTGIRPGEKLHEVLISADENRCARDAGDHYVIEALFGNPIPGTDRGFCLPDDFEYTSNGNSEWLDIGDLQRMLSVIS